MEIINLILLFCGGATFIALVVAWGFVFSAVTLKDLPVLQTGEESAKYILTTPRNETLWNASEKYHQALEKVNAIHDKKAYRINISIRSMWCIAVFFCAICYTYRGTERLSGGRNVEQKK